MRILLFLAVVGTEGLIIVTTVECAQGSEAQKGSVNQVGTIHGCRLGQVWSETSSTWADMQEYSDCSLVLGDSTPATMEPSTTEEVDVAN